MKYHRNKKKYIFGLVIFIFILVIAFVSYLWFKPQPDTHNYMGLPIFTLAELKNYNGTNPELPIYIGLDGYVYDVTLGKKFYGPDGSYHDLAGTDASRELRIFGGDIIKRKYQIIGNVGQ